MKRRTYLATAAALTGAAFAGCAGEDTEYGDLPDEENVTNREEGEDYLEYGPLQIVEHELVAPENEFANPTVEGVVAHTGEEAQFSYVEVGVRVYDDEGRHLDRYMTNTQDLGAGNEWAFEVMVLEDYNDVADYDIGITGRE